LVEVEVVINDHKGLIQNKNKTNEEKKRRLVICISFVLWTSNSVLTLGDAGHTPLLYS